MNNNTQNDQLQLVQVIDTIWSGKWKIVAFVGGFLLVAVAFLKLSPPPPSIATTQIKEIASADIDQYGMLNTIGFFEISQEGLLSLYNERLTNPETLQTVFMNLQLVDQQKYDDYVDYISAVKSLTAKVELLPPVNTDGSKRGISREFWTLKFKYHDRKKWLTALKKLDEIATAEVFNILTKRFHTLIKTRDLEDQFLLEDIQTKLKNMVIDYEKKTSNKLAYLSEQAAIARKLGVEQHTIGAQTFGADNTFVANLDVAQPFYLRGYKAIEKEIDLIKSRKDSRTFIDGMIEIEQEARSIKEDKTVARAKSLFLGTPLSDIEAFRAVTITVEGTKFESKSNRSIFVLIAAVMGGMIGVVYLLTASALKKYKNASTA